MPADGNHGQSSEEQDGMFCSALRFAPMPQLEEQLVAVETGYGLVSFPPIGNDIESKFDMQSVKKIRIRSLELNQAILLWFSFQISNPVLSPVLAFFHTASPGMLCFLSFVHVQ